MTPMYIISTTAKTSIYTAQNDKQYQFFQYDAITSLEGIKDLFIIF